MRTTKKLPYPRQDIDGTQLGINLSDPKIIAKIKKTLATKSRTPHGFTFQDWLQEILLILWRRNHQPSAFDPRKASIETYILIVARSVSLKLERKYFTKLPQILYVDSMENPENIAHESFSQADLDLAIDLLRNDKEQE